MNGATRAADSGVLMRRPYHAEKNGRFTMAAKRDRSQRMAIGPAQETLAIDLFGLEGAGVAVEVADRFHVAF